MNILSVQYGNIMNPYTKGGLPHSLHQNLKLLASRHSIVCLTGIMPDKPKKSFLDGILYVQAGIRKHRFINRLSFSTTALALKENLNYDIILIPWDRYSPVLFPARSECPVILELRLEYLSAPSKLIFIEPIIKKLLIKKLAKCHYLISASRNVLEVARKYSPNLRLFLISPSGVSQELITYSNNSSQENYLLFLGRLDIKHKGIDILIKAYHKADIDLPLIIAGDGPDNVRIRKLIIKHGLDHKVVMTGWVDGEDKLEILSNCLAVCMPSRVEGWGTVAMEAAAMGKPVIGTRVVGLTEAVLEGNTGVLVAKNDVNELSYAIRLIIADKVLRRDLGENARKRVKKFTWNHLAREREEFFYKVIEDFESRAHLRFSPP